MNDQRDHAEEAANRAAMEREAREELAAERLTNYGYLGDLAGSRSMNLTVRKINSIDQDGTWVTVWDEEDMECEVILAGMTPEMIQAAMIEWGY